MDSAPDTQYMAEWFARHRDAGRTGRRLADGDRFAGWEVLGFLGKGGSGEVYRARPEGGGTAVALKVLRGDRPGLAARMRREADVLAAHPHPALPRLVAAGEEGGRPYLVLEELVPRELPSRDRDVARLLLALCAGVEHLHRLGLVHRDIKPGNILFRTDGSPVLIDLGLVKDLAEEDAAPTGESPSVVSGAAVGVGTPGFSAPEQFAGGKVTPSADVYALGVLADACFGHRPPRRWRALLRRATSALEAERPATAADLARAIRRRRLPSLPAAIAAVAITGAAALAAVPLSRPASADAPSPKDFWELSFTDADSVWNAKMSDGNWELAVFAEENLVQVLPDYSHARVFDRLDLSKEVFGERDGRRFAVRSVGYDPVAWEKAGAGRAKSPFGGAVMEIVLPDGLVELGAGALANCDRVAEIDLPASLRRIGPGAFWGCKSLAAVRIPAGVEDVSDDGTFMGCSSLSSIEVEEGNPEYRVDEDGNLVSADGRIVAYPPARAAGRGGAP